MARTGPRIAKTPFAPTKRYRFSVSVSTDPVLHAFLGTEGVEKMLELFTNHLIDSDHPCANPETLKELIYQAMIQGGSKQPAKKTQANKPVKSAPAEKVREQSGRVIKQASPKTPFERPAPNLVPPAYKEPAKQEREVYEEPEAIAPPVTAVRRSEQPMQKEEISDKERQAMEDLDILINSQGDISRQRKIWMNDEV